MAYLSALHIIQGVDLRPYPDMVSQEGLMNPISPGDDRWAMSKPHGREPHEHSALDVIDAAAI